MIYRCVNNMWLYCKSPDHAKVCDDFVAETKMVDIPGTKVPCTLDYKTCGFAKTNTEVCKETPDRRVKSFKDVLFPGTSTTQEDKEKEIKAKKKKSSANKKEELEQSQKNFFGDML